MRLKISSSLPAPARLILVSIVSAIVVMSSIRAQAPSSSLDPHELRDAEMEKYRKAINDLEQELVQTMERYLLNASSRMDTDTSKSATEQARVLAEDLERFKQDSTALPSWSELMSAAKKFEQDSYRARKACRTKIKQFAENLTALRRTEEARAMRDQLDLECPHLLDPGKFANDLRRHLRNLGDDLGDKKKANIYTFRDQAKALAQEADAFKKSGFVLKRELDDLATRFRGTNAYKNSKNRLNKRVTEFVTALENMYKE